MKMGHTGLQKILNFHTNRAHRISEKWNFQKCWCESGACPDLGKMNFNLCSDGKGALSS